METIELHQGAVWKYNRKRRDLATRRAKVDGTTLTCQQRRMTRAGYTQYLSGYRHTYASAIDAWAARDVFLGGGFTAVNNHRRAIAKAVQRPLRQHIDEVRPS